MHPINRILQWFNLRLSYCRRPLSRQFSVIYQEQRSRLQSSLDHLPFETIVSEPHEETGNHPKSRYDFECAFFAAQIAVHKPARILDIGSYRLFVLGLAAGHCVTTLDVRPISGCNPAEAILKGHAEAIPCPDASFNAVLCLCALEHFGLGRYGDKFDPEGDMKGLSEMMRVLTPGGQLYLSVPITRDTPHIVFNAHRIYTPSLLDSMLGSSFRCSAQTFYSMESNLEIAEESICTTLGKWDIYCGSWIKQ